jgi:hypothetical protein
MALNHGADKAFFCGLHLRRNSPLCLAWCRARLPPTTHNTCCPSVGLAPSFGCNTKLGREAVVLPRKRCRQVVVLAGATAAL